VLVAIGCGGPAYEYDAVVTGTVTIDGELAKSGSVAFHPVTQGRPAIGHIRSDGSYALRTGQGDLTKVDGGTVMPGEYAVTVSIKGPPREDALVAEGGPPIPGPSLIASKYAQKATTDLRFTVKPGPQVIVLNLERAEPQPPSEDVTNTTDGEETGEADAAGDFAKEGESSSVESPPSETVDAIIEAPETKPALEETAPAAERTKDLEKQAQ
jgi:hypothetical protein